jgi:hypothetical protein
MLYALVLTVCSIQSQQCVNYVARLYASPVACQIDALAVRQFRKPGPNFARCVPTTRGNP